MTAIEHKWTKICGCDVIRLATSTTIIGIAKTLEEYLYTKDVTLMDVYPNVFHCYKGTAILLEYWFVAKHDKRYYLLQTKKLPYLSV